VRRRLYLQLYAALLASVFVCLVVAAVAFRFLRDSAGPPGERTQHAAAVLPERLPDVHAPDARARVLRLADEFGVDIIVGNPAGPLLGVPSPHAFPIPPRIGPGWRRGGAGPVLLTSLGADGWAALRPRGPYRRLRMHPFFATLVALALVMAVASYPVARRVTRRLEELTSGVERWGRGELRLRVPVTGGDEVATLASTFNQAAERLELLLGQQRQMLANASHELRSPLARLRMGLELIADEPDANRRQKMVQEIHRDIVELDGLIEEVLLFARTDDRIPRRPAVPVDLRVLLEEEAARTGAVVAPALADAGGDGGDKRSSPVFRGDAVLLRHLVRNLLENAQRHGGDGPVNASMVSDSANVKLIVEDRGPGVPEEDRERIFAPFYRRAGGAPSLASGHGLGLALVRQVARYHGGDVTFQSRAHSGSRFEVTLPFSATS
jgi:two-component system OmpR family sensor kinase